jgi:hypothetical protein
LRHSTLKLNLDEDCAAGMRILQILNEIILLFSKNMVSWHTMGQDTPYSCTWPFSKQLSVEPKRNNRYITDAIFKVLSESHVIRTTICNRRNVKMPNWKLANLCGTAGDNAHTISTCSICCQTLYLIVAECVPLAIEDNSRDIGSMPF